MKKLIGILSISLFLGVGSLSAQCCNGAESASCGSEDCSESCGEGDVVCAGQQKDTQVKAFYFHATRRCATCQAVESVSKEAIKKYYGDKVSFESVNIEDANNKALLKEYKISGQTLLVVNGKKTVNLTNDAFLNARTNPDKLKSKLKSTIDSMM